MEDGSVVEKERDILSLVHNYYDTLFTSIAEDLFDELLQNVNVHVSQEMNRVLLKPFSEEGVKLGLQMV